MKFFNLNDPFYRPLWIRVAIVAVVALWSVFEFARGAPIWGALFVILGAFVAWQFATIDYDTPTSDQPRQSADNSDT